MIQWSRVSELRDEVGAEDFGEVVDLFLEEVEDVIARLRTEFDRSQLEGDLHFLKGSALNLGFSTFSDLCQDGERKSSKGDASLVDLREILAEFERSKLQFMSQMSEQFGA